METKDMDRKEVVSLVSKVVSGTKSVTMEEIHNLDLIIKEALITREDLITREALMHTAEVGHPPNNLIKDNLILTILVLRTRCIVTDQVSKGILI
jgi:hypothetical protein